MGETKILSAAAGARKDAVAHAKIADARSVLLDLTPRAAKMRGARRRMEQSWAASLRTGGVAGPRAPAGRRRRPKRAPAEVSGPARRLCWRDPLVPKNPLVRLQHNLRLGHGAGGARIMGKAECSREAIDARPAGADAAGEQRECSKWTISGAEARFLCCRTGQGDARQEQQEQQQILIRNERDDEDGVGQPRLGSGARLRCGPREADGMRLRRVRRGELLHAPGAGAQKTQECDADHVRPRTACRGKGSKRSESGRGGARRRRRRACRQPGQIQAQAGRSVSRPSTGWPRLRFARRRTIHGRASRGISKHATPGSTPARI